MARFSSLSQFIKEILRIKIKIKQIEKRKTLLSVTGNELSSRDVLLVNKFVRRIFHAQSVCFAKERKKRT